MITGFEAEDARERFFLLYFVDSIVIFVRILVSNPIMP